MIFALVFLMILLVSPLDAFCPVRCPPSNKLSRKQLPLCMGKGLNRAQNKQAELRKKMELAKKEKGESTDDPPSLPNKEQVEDRVLFAQLLAQSSAPITAKERIITSTQSVRKSADRITSKVKDKKQRKRKKENKVMEEPSLEEATLQQGDVAQRRHFESLLNDSTPLGATRAAQLVPWVPPYLTSYLVIVADPRRQSRDLRECIQFLTSNLPPDMVSQVIAVTTDSQDEIVR